MRIGSALRKLTALSVLLLAGWLNAQSFDLDRGRETLVSLDGLWRFHPGDSPVSQGALDWTAGDFDDTSWKLLKSSEPWTDQGYAGMGGFAWYRFKVHVPAGERPTGLLLAPIVSSYQVYVDGRLVGDRGPMPPARMPSSEISYHIFPITEGGRSAPRTVQVALRMWHAPIWASYVDGGPLGPGHMAGDPDLLIQEQEHHQSQRNVRFVDAYSYSIITALVGFAILGLFFIQPEEREYLWFALLLLAQSADDVLYVGQNIFAWFPSPAYDLLDAALVALTVCASLQFFSLVLETPPGKLGRSFLVMAAISPVASVLYWPHLASPAASASIQIALLLPAVLWVLYTLVRKATAGNLDARLLLVPTLLDMGFYFADNLAIVLAQAGWTRVPHIFEVPLPLPPFTVQTGTLLHLVFLLALLIFLIRRFSLARREEERLAGEFEAARQVQLMLLPDELDLCPGFHVESIYRPADEVGGDFFQQIADGRGGMLIVVGDVSGKGLPAALIVSVLVGAIRAEAAHGTDPAALLASLNDRMMGRAHGGFVTCLAAHLDKDGQMTLSNAGHLSPYLNGKELPVSASLPLGLVDSARYESLVQRLAPSDRLTFVSDGVVEAQSRNRELFGFERTLALSCSSAQTIAETAQEFGQQDDITVVTVDYCGTPCENPTGAGLVGEVDLLRGRPATA